MGTARMDIFQDYALMTPASSWFLLTTVTVIVSQALFLALIVLGGIYWMA